LALEKGNFDEVRSQVESYTAIGEVILITQDFNNFSGLFSNVIHVPSGFHISPSIGRILYFIKGYLALWKRRKEIKLVRAYGIGSVHAAFFCRVCRIPLIASYEYDWSDQMFVTGRVVAGIFARRIENYVFTTANAIVGSSIRLCEKAQNRGAKRVACIENAIDTRPVRAITAREIDEMKTGLGLSGRRIIMYAGRLHRIKRLPDLISSFAKLKAEGMNLALLIAGDGAEKATLTRIVEEEGLQEHVRFLGAIPHEQVYRFMKIADVFVLPSVMEGNPRVLLEAMLCGLPVVAYNVVGVNDVIINGKTGLLAEPFNVEDLSEAVRMLLTEPGLSTMLVNQAYATVVHRFNQEIILERNLELVRELLRGRL